MKKKLLSVLLVLAMAVGIGVCGAVPASSAELGDLIIGASVLAKVPHIASLWAYFFPIEMESLLPEMEAALLPEKNLDDVLEAMNAAVAEVNDDLANLLVNTSIEKLQQTEALCKEIFEENFTEEFIETFGAFQKALLQALDQYFSVYTKLDGLISDFFWLLSPELLSEAIELFDWMNNSNIFSPEEVGTFAELTAYYSEIAERISTTMSKIDAYNQQSLLYRIWQFILRYIFFGWLWM